MMGGRCWVGAGWCEVPLGRTESAPALLAVQLHEDQKSRKFTRNLVRRHTTKPGQYQKSRKLSRDPVRRCTIHRCTAALLTHFALAVCTIPVDGRQRNDLRVCPARVLALPYQPERREAPRNRGTRRSELALRVAPLAVGSASVAHCHEGRQLLSRSLHSRNPYVVGQKTGLGSNSFNFRRTVGGAGPPGRGLVAVCPTPSTSEMALLAPSSPCVRADGLLVLLLLLLRALLPLLA